MTSPEDRDSPGRTATSRRPSLRGLPGELSRFARLLTSLGLESAAEDTGAGRGAERVRRVALSGATTALARAATVGVTLVSVPLALGYLGPERYGMWMAITSLVGMLGFADLGLGNGLINEVSRAQGLGDRALVRRRTATAFVSLCVAALGVGAGLALVYPRVSWAGLFNVHTPQAALEAGPALAALVACAALGLPASVTPKLQAGLQAGFIASAWQGVGAVLSLVALIVAVTTLAPLPWLVLAVAAMPLVATTANALVFFRRAPEYRPRVADVDRASLRPLLGTGLMFFALQLAAAFGFASDSFIVAKVRSSAEVAQYAVPARLFATVPLVCSFVVGPLWPAYAEALTRGDHEWIRLTFLRTMRLAVGASALVSATLLAASPWILRFWVGNVVEVNWPLLTGLAVWSVLHVWGHAAAVLLNGLGALRVQVVTAVAFGLLCFGARLLAVERIGLAGIPVATVLTYTVTVFLPLSQVLRRTLSRLASGAGAGAGREVGPR